MDLNSQFEVVAPYLIIRGMICLGHRDDVSIYSECISIYDYILDKTYGEYINYGTITISLSYCIVCVFNIVRTLI